MIRIVVHMAVPDAKRALAATMSGLSGLPAEHIIELSAIPSGASALWDAAKGYGGKWWGASQALSPDVAQPMLASGYALETESWFAAFWENTNTLVPNGTNLDPPPSVSSFDAFLAASGLEKVVTSV